MFNLLLSNERFESVRVYELIARDVLATSRLEVTAHHVVVLHFHSVVRLNDVLAVVEALVEMGDVVWAHECLVMVDEYFLLVDLHELLF